MNGKIKATRHFLPAVTFVATSVLSAFAQISPCLVEAEAFADKGGWVVDPQFVEQNWQHSTFPRWAEKM